MSEVGPTYPSILRNLGAAGLSRIVGISVSLVRVPLVLGLLGVDDYALWIAVFSLVQAFSLSDLGIQYAVTQFVAEDRSHGGRESTGLSATGFWIVVGSICVLLGLIYGLDSAFELRSLVFGSVAGSETSVLVGVGLVTVLLQQPAAVAEATLRGHELIEQVARVEIARSIAQLALLLLLAIVIRPSVIGFGVTVLIFDLITRLATTSFFVATYGDLISFSPSDVDRSQVKRLTHRGFAFFSGTIATTARSAFDNLIVLRVAGPLVATQYALATQLFIMSLSFIALLPATVWPRITTYIAQKKWRWVDDAYRTLVASTLVAGAVMAVGAVAVGRDFIAFWANIDNPPAVGLLAVLGAGMLLYIVHLDSANVLNAMGMTASVTVISSFEVAAKLLTAWILLGALEIGAMGMALSVLVGSGFAATASTWRLWSKSMGQLRMPILLMTRLLMATAATCVVAIALREQLNIGTTTEPVRIMVIGLLSTTAICVAIWILALEAPDRRAMQAQLQQFRRSH